MNDYRYGILDRISTELADIDWVELPDDVREFTGEFGKLEISHEDRHGYLFIQLGKYQLIIGFGDTDPYMWDGTIYWSFSIDFATDVFYSGEIRNGSSRYVIWELFDQLNEQLKIKNGAN